MEAYRPLRAARHEIVRLRGLEANLTHWGTGAAQTPTVLLHGWLDCGDTFQFLVDALPTERRCTALDWRGMGRSGWTTAGYWFPDYLADLDALLGMMSPDAPVCLVGHSMGGNIAALYAGIRPDRVLGVVSLEGFGLPRTSPEAAPSRYGKWLTQLAAGPRHKEYASFDELTAVIRMRYPRFTEQRAAFVAQAWGRLTDGGGVRLAADPRHHWVNPILYKREDAEACWRNLRAPLLMVAGSESDVLAKLGADGTPEALRSFFPHMHFAEVRDAGHMLHIERAEDVAGLVERFLDAPR